MDLNANFGKDLGVRSQVQTFENCKLNSKFTSCIQQAFFATIFTRSAMCQSPSTSPSSLSSSPPESSSSHLHFSSSFSSHSMEYQNHRWNYKKYPHLTWPQLLCGTNEREEEGEEGWEAPTAPCRTPSRCRWPVHMCSWTGPPMIELDWKEEWQLESWLESLHFYLILSLSSETLSFTSFNRLALVLNLSIVNWWSPVAFSYLERTALFF